MLGQRRAPRAWVDISPPTVLNYSCAAPGAAGMKNQLLGSYKGSPTPKSRGWVKMGAPEGSGSLDVEEGSISTPHTQGLLLGAWSELELPAPVQGSGGGVVHPVGPTLPLPLWFKQW